jgi:propionyl-CoA:succinyl-CoA transferase
MAFYQITAQEAAEMVQNGQTIGVSGFSRAGAPKCIIPEIAKLAREEHSNGNPYKINVYTGGSVGPSCDTELSEANAVNLRIPYAANKDLRAKTNMNELEFADLNLSDMACLIRKQFVAPVDWAIVEACEVEQVGENARIYPTAGVGIMPTICHLAKKGIFIELNAWHSTKLIGMHDLYELEDFPHRTPINITKATDCVGLPYVEVPARMIRGVLECNLPDEAATLSQPSEVTDKIGEQITFFLMNDMRSGRIPSSFLNLQSGVGSTANAVLKALGDHKEIPDFSLYTEVLQDAPLTMMLNGRIKSASTSCLAVPSNYLQEMYKNLEEFRGRLVLRPTEMSNNPEVIARIGVCALNTALEVDVYGHVNSTEVCGTRMMNGVGGSCDFSNHAYLSVFSCGATKKNGTISTIVPFCSHVDHTNHYVHAIVTEYGVADLRAKSPMQRAAALIEIAHPDYRSLLRDYLKLAERFGGHIHHVLPAAFAMHDTYRRKGDMRLTDWSEYIKE